MRVTPKKPKIKASFHENQWKAYNFSTQFGAAVAGVQSGKTFLGAYWSFKKIEEFPSKNGIIVAPTYKILQQATLKKFFETFPYFRRFYKEQKGEIQLPGGGTIFIRSADQPLGIEGITAQWIWLDEGGMTSLLTWTVLRSRVSMTGGQILITTTPYNMGWLFTEIYRPFMEKTDPAISFFTWRSIDNPLFSKDFYEAERKRLPPEEFARRYEGEFRKMAGLVWDIPGEQIIDFDSQLKQMAEARVMGVDWGFRNPAAIVVAYLIKDKWFIVDEWKKAERTTAEIIQSIQSKVTEHQIRRVYPDPAEPDRIEECRREGVPVYLANKDVEGGISLIRQLIYEKRFFVTKNCKMFIEEASMYHFPESDHEQQGEEKELPVKFNDHLCFTEDTVIQVPIGETIRRVSMGKKDVYEFMGSKVTANHPYLTARGFVALDALRYDDTIVLWKNKLLTELYLDGTRNQKGVSFGVILHLLRRNVSAIKQNVYTGIYGKNRMEKYPRAIISIIKTGIRLITLYLISSFSLRKNMPLNISKRSENEAEKRLRLQFCTLPNGMLPRPDISFMYGWGSTHGKIRRNLTRPANNAGKDMSQRQNSESSATIIAKLKHCGQEDVYATTTTNGFFLANGIVVSNCDALRYAVYSWNPQKIAVPPIQNPNPLYYYPELRI